MMGNGFKNGKQRPYPLVEKGKGHQQLLVSRSQAVLNALINLLPSNYESSVVGPNYTVYMKAMATELARITIILERLGTDVSFDEVRSEFLWETVGYLVFLNQQLPDLEFDDESFRDFLKAVIEIYFEGSTPEAIRKGVELFTSEEFTIRENFEDARQEGSPLDISDQFGFSLDFDLEAEFPKDVFRFDKNLRLLIEIIRPAHTLYRLRFMFGEDADLLNNVTDEMRMHLRNYYYDDARGYCAGMAGFDSTSGYIELGSLSVLKDDATDKPLASVAEGATLLIETGTNSGRYTVVGHPTTNSVRVFPKFKGAEDPVSYHVEVDRLGRKKELLIEEDVSSQFHDTSRLTVDGGGPYTVEEMSDITLTATSSGSDVEYVWDLDGDNVYDDASGASVTYTAPSGPAEITVWVMGTDPRGRKAKDSATITVLDQHQVQMLGTATLTINDVTWSTSASASMEGTGTLLPSPTMESFASVSMEGRSIVEVILGRNPDDPCAVSMYGMAFVNAEASVIRNLAVEVAMIGEAAVTPTMVQEHIVSVMMAGTATITGDETIQAPGTVTMAGTANLNSELTQIHRPSTEISGAGTTTINAEQQMNGSVAIAGTASTSVSSTKTTAVSVSIVGSGTTTVSATQTYSVSTTVSGTGTTTVSATKTVNASTSMTGTGTTAMVASKVVNASVATTGSGTTTIAATKTINASTSMVGTANTTTNSTYTMDPTSITGLVYWIDPDDTSTLYQDNAGINPVTATGQPVERIEDKSGNGYHFINETNVPAWDSTGIAESMGALEWDGSPALLSAINITELNTGQPISIFSVAQSVTENTTFLLNHNYADGSDSVVESRRLWRIFFGEGGWGTNIYDATGTLHTTLASASANLPYVINTEWAGDDLHVRIEQDSDQVQGVANASPTDINAVELGMTRDGTGSQVDHFTGLSGEIICYASALSTTDETRLRQYLADKWLP